MTFAVLTIYNHLQVATPVSIVMCVLGLGSAAYACTFSRSFLDHRLKFLNSLLYITGAWFNFWVGISTILYGKSDRKNEPAVFYALIGYPILVVTLYLLRYVPKLQTLTLD